MDAMLNLIILRLEGSKLKGFKNKKNISLQNLQLLKLQNNFFHNFYTRSAANVILAETGPKISEIQIFVCR